MAPHVDQNPQKRAPHHAARSQESAPGVDQPSPRQLAQPDTPVADDLPDIVDVVMDMGRTPEEHSTDAPSPPPVIANPPLAGTSRRARRPGTRLCRGREFAQHPPRLCGRLAPFCQLVPPSGPRDSSTGPADRRPLRHRLRVWHGDWRQEARSSVSTIERRLSSLSWNYAQRGQPLDRKDRHIATVMAGIRNRHAAPPRQKEASCRRI